MMPVSITAFYGAPLEGEEEERAKRKYSSHNKAQHKKYHHTASGQSLHYALFLSLSLFVAVGVS